MKIEILVREIRLKQNMTLETLAELSGISKGHLSKIERQERAPKLSTMIMIAKALKVDIEELYKIVKWHFNSVVFIFHKGKWQFYKMLPKCNLIHYIYTSEL